MTVFDLDKLPPDTELTTEVCIVGSGPAGATLAAELAGSSLRVLVVESGGREPEAAVAALNEVENVGAARVADQELMRTRALGGTSRIWTGRCAELDEIDYRDRPWVAHSGWPLTGSELRPFLDRARSYLGLGPNLYDERLWALLGRRPARPPLPEARLVPRFWQFSRGATDPAGPTRFGLDVLPDAVGDDAAVDEPRGPAGSGNVNVLLHATVTHIDTDDTGAVVRGVEVASTSGRQARIRAAVVVLAAGGIENARLMLASNRVVPHGVGNGNDLVGRFLMDHPGSVIASVDPGSARRLRDRFGRYWLDGPDGRQVYLHGVGLSPQAQREEELLNCAAFLEEYPAPADPWHAGQRLASRLRGGGEPEQDEVALASFWRREDEVPEPTAVRDALTLARNAPALATGAYRMTRRHRPPIFQASRVDVYCLVEQEPDPSSRVTLSDRVDGLGVPLSRVDWRVSERERTSIGRLAGLLAQELGGLGYASPEPAEWLKGGAAWRENVIDRAHPIGTTRMADNPRAGVVDRNCQVHETEGLFVAGSSTFPTAGHVNPTLTIVALAIRLADHLKARGRADQLALAPSPAVSS
ncbi:GMC family oxidoreductase [Frankia sp. AgB1.9]|uniref:GMC oxidoreductase n=1 Tax=unclassified Frankia TaxID=2632575 RepID=UPI0019324864|nr:MULTISPECIES: GMC family oxidoreductase [unclassified Frankia]MBL7494062.1 GMC family oxidoreductase [Frankia sp. AgW1.1]MBL7552544.1 GMC family oxidoreductase [Frankia sp. AgB1.9]MBL7624751.1 GMC family oxidoreductase [Frankia sp. AgB1.8]